MAYCRFVLPILVLSVVQIYATQVPVFLWGDLLKTSIKSNPLSTLSSSEFDRILRNEIESNPFTVICIEETLSVEDFSRKNGNGATSFPYLHANIGDSLYLPSVQNALQVLNKLADPDKVDRVKLTENGLSAEIEPESGKFLFIYLKDAKEGESRADLLRRHNDFMEDIFTKLQEKYDRVIGVYTAHYPSWIIPESHSRIRRQAQLVTNEYALDNLLLYVKQLILRENRNSIALSNPIGNKTNLNDTLLSTTFEFTDNSVTLNFISNAGYWSLNSVTLSQTSPRVETHELYSNSEVYALLGFSYRCAQNVTFTGGNNTVYTLTFEDLKVQPFFQAGNASELVFGDAFNCVGFFSVPIWAGLFVVFILLGITFYGIIMMMDIRTMDRFDDPKGKTITISAAE